CGSVPASAWPSPGPVTRRTACSSVATMRSTRTSAAAATWLVPDAGDWAKFRQGCRAGRTDRFGQAHETHRSGAEGARKIEPHLAFATAVELQGQRAELGVLDFRRVE